MSSTFYELFADNLIGHAERTAVIDLDASFSYATVAQRADAIAQALRERFVGTGDRVIVHLRKSMDEIAAMIGIAKLGAVIVNVNAQWTVEQLSYVANDCGALVILTETPVVVRVTVARPALTSRLLAIGDIGVPEAQTDSAAIPVLETALAAILYTSGSTGMPKGVMLSHRNILVGARSTSRYLGLRGDDRLLAVLPYSFDYGLNQLTSMLLLGGTVVHQAVPMPAEIIRTIQRHEVTGVAAVPPLWAQLVRLLDQSPAAFPSLRLITNSGGAITPNILEKMPHVFPGVEIYLMYGLTEAFRSTFLPPADFHRKMGAIGRAVPNAEIYVVKHGVGIAGPGEQGELVHRGPLVSLGYWGSPEATSVKIRQCPELSSLIGDEPVVYSGDIVRVDQDGYLWFVGRDDAMIKTSGFRVSPEEVEAGIASSGLVTDVVAFGRPDDDLGQVIHVAVVPMEDFDEAALLAHCRLALPHYMVPRSIHVWRQPMPRTSSGKLARPDIVQTSISTLSAKQNDGGNFMLTSPMLIGYLKSMVGGVPLDADSALFSNGMLDSMLMVNLITFVEQKAQIQVRGEDVTLDNFDTPDRIVRFAQSQV